MKLRKNVILRGLLKIGLARPRVLFEQGVVVFERSVGVFEREKNFTTEDAEDAEGAEQN